MSNMTTPNPSAPKKIGVWSEGSGRQAQEHIVSKRTPESSDDIPTIPDLDDLQDILEKEISLPTRTEQSDKETINVLAEVGEGVVGSGEGLEAAFEFLKSYTPQEKIDSSDTVWTVDTLLSQLADEDNVL